MENGNEQKGKHGRSTLAEELAKLASSKISVEVSYKDFTDSWDVRLGGAMFESFTNQWDIVPWLRKTADWMFPNSEYTKNNRAYKHKNHDQRNHQNVNRRNNKNYK